MQTIGSLAGVAGSNVYLGNGMLTVGADGTNTSFAGVIADSGGASSNTGGSLIKTGSGMQTLSGANTYTGGTTINGGQLIVANASGTSATSTGMVTVNSTGTLSGSQTAAQGFIGAPVTVNSGGTIASYSNAGVVANSLTLTIGTVGSPQTVTLNSGSNLTFNLTNTPNGTSNPLLTIFGNLNLAGSGVTVTLPGTNANVTSGTYDLISYTGTLSNFSNFGTITGPNPYLYTLFNNTAQNQIDLNVIGTLTWTGQTSGNGGNDSNWNTASTNWAGGTAYPSPAVSYIDGGLLDVQFTDANLVTNGGITNSTVTIQGSGVSPKSVTFNNSGVNYLVQNASGSTGITGSTGLLKTGTGIVTLSSVNTYTGITTISGGVLAVSVDHALGSNASATVTSGGELKLSNVAYTSQSITLAGAGTDAALYGTGTSSFAGAITLSDNSTIGASIGSTLTIGGAIETNGQGLTLNGGGTINLNAINNAVNPSTASTVDVNGTIVNFNAGNSYGGTTTIENNGLLRLNNAGALPAFTVVGTPGLVVKTGGTLDLNGNSSTVSDITLSGGTINDALSTATLVAQSVTVNGSGNVINAAVNTGNVNLNANANLVINSAVTGDVNFSDGASLSGTGNITAAANGASLANNNTLSSTGVLTLDGITVNGTGNQISSGTVVATFQVVIGSGAALTVNGALSDVPTVYVGGTLLVGDASHPAATLSSNDVEVDSGGLLGGHGTITGPVTVNPGGAVEPGGSIGTLTIAGAYTQGDSTALDYILNTPAPGDHSEIDVTGGLLTLGSNVDVSVTGSPIDGTYVLFTYDDGLTGSVSSWYATGLPVGAIGIFSTAIPNEVDLTIVVPVPEPASLGLLGLGALSLLGRKRRKRRE